MPYTIPSSVISPGAVYQPRKSKFILDQIPGAIAAWSTRRLISTAPANIARGRDASTNEQDFTAAELAGSGFTDLAGAGDGFYVTLYDQIGSNNATQSTAANQPKGVGTGALITDGAGVPVLDFDGAGDYLEASQISLASDFSISFQIKFDSLSSKHIFYYVSNHRILIASASRITCAFSGSYINLDTDTPLVSGSYYNLTITRSGSVIRLYVDAVAQLNTASSSASYIFKNISTNVSNSMDASVSSVIIFNRALSASDISKLYNALA